MSPFAVLVVSFLAVLFIILSLVPLLADLSDGPGLDDIQSREELSGMPNQNLMDMDK
jgi:hypothetical protein